VTNAVKSSQSLLDAYKSYKDTMEAVARLYKSLQAAAKAAQAVPDTNSIINMVISGKIRKVKDIIEAIQITKDLPKLIDGLQGDIQNIAKFSSTFGSQVNEVKSLLEAVVKNELNAQVAQPIRDGVTEIKKLIQDEVFNPIQQVVKKTVDVSSAIKAIPFKPGSFSMKADVASYRRWSTVSMNLPCTRQKRADYEVAGFKGSFDYPEFYPCPYGPKEIPWPNHHIPYVKFRIA